MNLVLELSLSVLLAGTAVAVVRTHDRLALTVLLSVYSGVLAVLFALLGAVDVAFTEVVVGTAVSTGLLLALLRRSRPLAVPAPPAEVAAAASRKASKALALGVAAAVGGVLLHGIWALPALGDAATPTHTHLAAIFAAHALKDTDTPNLVTAVLADYRGFDTLVETAVVVTGAVGCLLVLRREAEPDRTWRRHGITA